MVTDINSLAVENAQSNADLLGIAHRLNTIETADEIFFVNGGAIKPAGSFAQAVEMLMHGKRAT